MIPGYIQSATLLASFSVLLVQLGGLGIPAAPEVASDRLMACPSGRAAARLTGWALNEKTPVGRAEYVEAAKSLEVSVESVALPDGTRLAIFVGEEKIGDMEPLKQGTARVVLSKALTEGDRVRVFNSDRPIVSANLQCVTGPAPAPTISPSPLPSPSPSPSVTPGPTPSPSPSPSPTAEPTQDPMPKRSPLATPSPS